MTTALALPEMPQVPAHLVATAREYLAAADAPNTRRVYAGAWSRFDAWCAERGQAALPADAAVVALYLTGLAEQGLSWSTIGYVTAAAISRKHVEAGYPSPRHDPLVARLLAGIRRQLRVAPKQAAPLLIEDLRQIVEVLPHSPIGQRDRAVLLLGFAGMFRRAELAALRTDDLEAVEEGLVVTIRQSKTDQAGKGLLRGIPFGTRERTCPVRALRAWAALRSDVSGPLFLRFAGRRQAPIPAGLREEGISQVVKRAVARIGLEVADYSGHSLRAGAITTAAYAGVPIQEIMSQSGHRSLTGLQPYLRKVGLFDRNAAASLGL